MVLPKRVLYTLGKLKHYRTRLLYAHTHCCIFHIRAPRLTLVFPTEALEQGELGGVVGHGEFLEQGFDHLSHRVGAADVQSVYGASREIKRLLIFHSSCSAAFHRDGPPQVQLDLDEAGVLTIRILKDREEIHLPFISSNHRQKNILSYCDMQHVSVFQCGFCSPLQWKYCNVSVKNVRCKLQIS